MESCTGNGSAKEALTPEQTCLHNHQSVKDLCHGFIIVKWRVGPGIGPTINFQRPFKSHPNIHGHGQFGTASVLSVLCVAPILILTRFYAIFISYTSFYLVSYWKHKSFRLLKSSFVTRSQDIAIANVMSGLVTFRHQNCLAIRKRDFDVRVYNLNKTFRLLMMPQNLESTPV